MLSHIPLWVPAVFLLLTALGYRLSVTRVVRPGVSLGTAAAMLGFSAYGVLAAFGTEAAALGLWALGYALALLGGARLVPSRGMAVVAAGVRVPGSWVPMGLLLGIFMVKFALGFAVGVHSPLVHSAWFVTAASAALGMLSGAFGARAVVVHRFARGAGAA